MNRDELETAINRYLDGVADEAETAALSHELETSELARQRYVRFAHVHATLAARATAESLSIGGETVTFVPERTNTRPWRQWVRTRIGLAACLGGLLLLAGAMILTSMAGGRRAVAQIGALRDARWIGAPMNFQPGDPLRPGQVLQLSAGGVDVRFASGAELTLFGPAIFEVTSRNSGFLTLGQLRAKAAPPASKGFTVQTRTARLVDVGTEFVAAAAADGQSRVDVMAGEVVMLLDGVKAPQRVREGDALSVEAGRAQVLVRIERGDGTAAFRFPTIEPPSDRDLADASRRAARIQVVKGSLHTTATIPSGPVDRLLDGRGQSRPNSPAESVFFENNASGLLLLDLGRACSVDKINTYSWHESGENRVRAVQKYTLYGSAAEPTPNTDGDLIEGGWVQLARVNSDDFFHVVKPVDRPAQQACSITGARGTIGRYRYLLWAVEPTQSDNPRFQNNTFYAEFDVYGQP